jgi:hypothetical protein
MSKAIAISMVFVLLAASGALADIIQDQYTGIGLTNTLALMHGDQQAGSQQNLIVDNAQCATGSCGGLAQEAFFAAIGQAGNASGYCGLVDVIQVVGVDGMQIQSIGDGVAPKAQLQTLDVVAGQALGKADGLGVANALHTIVINEAQTGNNAGGVMNESATVMGMQTSTVQGQPGSTAVVDSTMVITTSQSQATM